MTPEDRAILERAAGRKISSLTIAMDELAKMLTGPREELTSDVLRATFTADQLRLALQQDEKFGYVGGTFVSVPLTDTTRRIIGNALKHPSWKK